MTKRGVRRFSRIMSRPHLKVVPGGGVLPPTSWRPVLPPRTLAVTGGMGGVGITSLTVNLSLALAELGKRVLVVGRDRRFGTMDGVGFLIAGSGYTDAQPVHMDAVERKRLLGSLVRVTKGFDFMLLDLAAGGDCLPLAIRSDEVLLVSTVDPVACAETNALTRRLMSLGCPAPRLVVNRAGSRADAEDIYARICRAPRAHRDAAPVYWGYIPEDPAVQQAVRWQKPFLVTAPRAPSSRHVRELAWRVLGGQTPGGGIHASVPLFRSGPGGRDRGHAA